MTETFMTIGRRLRNSRLLRRQTQEEVAAALGIKQATLSRYESELTMPTPDVHRKLAAYLDIPIAELRDVIERSDLEVRKHRLERALEDVNLQITGLMTLD